MHFQVTTYVLDTLRPREVRVDVHIDAGRPGLRIEGFSAGEARRVGILVRDAIANSGLLYPEGQRVRVQIAPSPLPVGGGEGMCLAIALAVLAAFGQVRREALRGLAVAGNLRADATIGPVRGALQIAEAVAEDPRLDSLAIASQSAPEAACAPGVEVMQLYSLAALRYIDEGHGARLRPRPRPLPTSPDPRGPDFADLRGQGIPRRAAEIAAAGDHSLLLAAPAGAGQALLARRIPSILPPLRRAEALEVLRIASSAQEQSGSGVTGRPFRAPHPSAEAAILGGGSPVAPGEVTLAHRGVLFFDRIERFDGETLQAASTARATGRTFVGSPPLALPSSFLLLASAEFCPCGTLGAVEGSCSCGEAALARHLYRLAEASETFDMVCSYGPPGEEDLGAGRTGEPSCAVRSRVMEARGRQAARLGEGRTNRQMSLGETEDCGLGAEVVDALNRALPYPHQAGRRVRVAQVARTIADLAGAETIDTFHLTEALDLQPGRRPGAPRPTASGASDGRAAAAPDVPMDPGNSPGVATSPAGPPTT